MFLNYQQKHIIMLVVVSNSTENLMKLLKQKIMILKCG